MNRFFSHVPWPGPTAVNQHGVMLSVADTAYLAI